MKIEQNIKLGHSPGSCICQMEHPHIDTHPDESAKTWKRKHLMHFIILDEHHNNRLINIWGKVKSIFFLVMWKYKQNHLLVNDKCMYMLAWVLWKDPFLAYNLVSTTEKCSILETSCGTMSASTHRAHHHFRFGSYGKLYYYLLILLPHNSRHK